MHLTRVVNDNRLVETLDWLALRHRKVYRLLKILFDQVVHHSEYIHSVIVRTLISSIIDLYGVYKIYGTIIQVIKRSTHLSLVYIIITHI